MNTARAHVVGRLSDLGVGYRVGVGRRFDAPALARRRRVRERCVDAIEAHVVVRHDDVDDGVQRDVLTLTRNVGEQRTEAFTGGCVADPDSHPGAVAEFLRERGADRGSQRFGELFEWAAERSRDRVEQLVHAPAPQPADQPASTGMIAPFRNEAASEAAK